MPNEERPARREPPCAGAAHASGWPLAQPTKNGPPARSTLAFSALKCAVGTSVRRERHRAVLMRPVMPAAAFACPMLPLIEPMAQWPTSFAVAVAA